MKPSTPRDSFLFPSTSAGRQAWCGFSGCLSSKSDVRNLPHSSRSSTPSPLLRNTHCSTARRLLAIWRARRSDSSRSTAASSRPATSLRSFSKASFLRARVLRACSRFLSFSSRARSSGASDTPGGASGRAGRRAAGVLFFAGGGREHSSQFGAAGSRPTPSRASIQPKSLSFSSAQASRPAPASSRVVMQDASREGRVFVLSRACCLP